MSNRKLHSVTTRMLTVPGAAVVKTFAAEVPIEVEDPRGRLPGDPPQVALRELTFTLR